jgi:hypothetical protein
MYCPHCHVANPPTARFCSWCGQPQSATVAAPVAASPSTDRIKQEIRNKEREIDDIRRNIDERTEEYERKGYRNADPGWYIPLYKEIDKLTEEIRQLTSSL